MFASFVLYSQNPDNKVHEAHMGPTWVLSAPDGPHVGPMNHTIWELMWYFDPASGKLYICNLLPAA